MSGKRNPHENPESRTVRKPATQRKRKTYTRHADAVKAAKRKGGGSQVYAVKGGYRITGR